MKKVTKRHPWYYAAISNFLQNHLEASSQNCLDLILIELSSETLYGVTVTGLDEVDETQDRKKKQNKTSRQKLYFRKNCSEWCPKQHNKRPAFAPWSFPPHQGSRFDVWVLAPSPFQISFFLAKFAFWKRKFNRRIIPCAVFCACKLSYRLV